MIHNSPTPADRLLQHLTILYGREIAPSVHRRLLHLMETHHSLLASAPVEGGALALSERDAILITYGDQLARRDDPGARAAPLATLAGFCERHVAGIVSGVHVLPFFPSTSDDGFSVVDYRAVDPALGEWLDLSRLGQTFRLMFDGVVNHVSANSAWFRGFLAGDPRFSDYFIVVNGEPDLSQVVRPRALPLLTEVETARGPRRVWTTFSSDQIDLNFHSPDVLLEIVDTLLFYVDQGARLIRLDAIAYAWKEIGTPCIHLPQTHALIQLFRAVLDEVAPGVMLITETNVAHADNVSYFGDGTNESQMVYNFALPPLLLHTLYTGSVRVLADWARGLHLPSNATAFFNFTASHDGIGLNPVRGILSESEIADLVERVRAAGGLIAYKNNPDGSQAPYELNVNYLDALTAPGGADPLAFDRFMVSQAIMLALAGVPGLYFHSLFGSRGWPEGVLITGRNRTINRQKLDVDIVERELAQPGHLRQRVFERYRRLLLARASTPALHPLGAQEVLDGGDAIFLLVRRGLVPGQVAVCVHNISAYEQQLNLPTLAGVAQDLAGTWLGVVDGQTVRADISGQWPVRLGPYGFEWFIPRGAGGHER